jgi:hypothetical protein
MHFLTLSQHFYLHKIFVGTIIKRRMVEKTQMVENVEWLKMSKRQKYRMVENIEWSKMLNGRKCRMVEKTQMVKNVEW